jgi:hypothetical protein
MFGIPSTGDVNIGGHASPSHNPIKPFIPPLHDNVIKNLSKIYFKNFYKGAVFSYLAIGSNCSITFALSIPLRWP